MCMPWLLFPVCPHAVYVQRFWCKAACPSPQMVSGHARAALSFLMSARPGHAKGRETRRRRGALAPAPSMYAQPALLGAPTKAPTTTRTNRFLPLARELCQQVPLVTNAIFPLRPAVYAFGILLYELYTGQHAYYDIPPPMLAYHVATAGARPMLPAHCPTAYRALAKACWSSDVPTRWARVRLYRVTGREGRWGFEQVSWPAGNACGYRCHRVTGLGACVMGHRVRLHAHTFSYRAVSVPPGTA